MRLAVERLLADEPPRRAPAPAGPPRGHRRVGAPGPALRRRRRRPRRRRPAHPAGRRGARAGRPGARPRHLADGGRPGRGDRARGRPGRAPSSGRVRDGGRRPSPGGRHRAPPPTGSSPHLDAGERVAFVTLGDPNVYSTFSVAGRGGAPPPARPCPSSTVPGIMAFQDLAARAGTVLVDGDEQLVLVPAHAAGGDRRRRRGRRPGPRPSSSTRAAALLGELAERSTADGRLDGAVLGELLGLPGGRVARRWPSVGRPARRTYLATVIVPPPGAGDGGRDLLRGRRTGRRRPADPAGRRPPGPRRRGGVGVVAGARRGARPTPAPAPRSTTRRA